MSDFMQADIFFFVTTIAVILCTGAFLVIAWYVIQILRNVEDVAERASRLFSRLKKKNSK